MSDIVSAAASANAPIADLFNAIDSSHAVDPRAGPHGSAGLVQPAGCLCANPNEWKPRLPARLEFDIGPGRCLRNLDVHEGVIHGGMAIVAALGDLAIGLCKLPR